MMIRNMLVLLIVTIAVCSALVAQAFTNYGRHSLGQHHRLLLDSARSRKYLVPRASNSAALLFKVSEADEVDSIDEDIDFDEGLSFGDGRKGGLMRKLSKAAIPVAASIGFAVSPSTNLASRLTAAAIGGGAGLLAKVIVLDRIIASIDSEIELEDSDGGGSGGGSRGTILLPKAVQAVLDYYDSTNPPSSTYTLEGIERTAKKSGVKSNDLALLFTHLFAQIIFNGVQNESDDLTELSEIVDFASTVGLSDAEIGDGFALAAVRLGRTIEKDERGFTRLNLTNSSCYKRRKCSF